MANPLPYFKLDTTFDRRLETLIKLHGNDLLVVLIRTWQQVYYHAKSELDLSTPILVTALAMDCQLTEARLGEMIEVLVGASLFEEAAWKEGRLTSNGIRTRTDEALEKRRQDAERKRRKREERVLQDSPRSPHEEKRKEKKSKEEKRNTPREVRLIKKGEKESAAKVLDHVADPELVKSIVRGFKSSRDTQPATAAEIASRKQLMQEQLRQLESSNEQVSHDQKVQQV